MNISSTIGLVIKLAIIAILGYVAATLFVSGELSVAMMLVVITAAFAIIFFFKRFYSVRFYYPAIAGLLLFTVFPVVYTSYVGFTNYGGANLLTFERIQNYFTSQVAIDKSTEEPFQLFETADGLRLWLPESGLLSAPFKLATPEAVTLQKAQEPKGELLPLKAVVANRELLKLKEFTYDSLSLKTAGLKTVASLQPAYRIIDADGRLESYEGEILTPDHDVGFYRNAEGETLKPGWKTWIGTRNFDRMFNSEGIKEPIVSIFIWTLIFALGSMVGTFAVGITLALILQWRELKGKRLYRILLILPYAVPGFISILVFRGLFNQNFGEINFILEALFDIAPNWNTDPFLAKAMVLIVNIWLGYPYMMLLGMGFLQSIPEDHYKAAAIEGAGPVRQFFSITLPQILPPFVPMLIATFAFNFNNLVLIILLTKGGPDMVGTVVPAGETDILASFTYRIAFSDSSQDFGLAGAISMLMFVVVALIAYFNLAAMRKAAKGTR